MAKYLVLIYGDEQVWAEASAEWVRGNERKHQAFLAAAGNAVLGGHELEPAANAVSVRSDSDRVVVTDGPFAESKEVVGGYYLIEASDLDGAIELARKVPEVSEASSGVEVRRIKDAD